MEITSSTTTVPRPASRTALWIGGAVLAVATLAGAATVATYDRDDAPEASPPMIQEAPNLPLPGGFGNSIDTPDDTALFVEPTNFVLVASEEQAELFRMAQRESVPAELDIRVLDSPEAEAAWVHELGILQSLNPLGVTVTDAR